MILDKIEFLLFLSRLFQKLTKTISWLCTESQIFKENHSVITILNNFIFRSLKYIGRYWRIVLSQLKFEHRRWTCSWCLNRLFLDFWHSTGSCKRNRTYRSTTFITRWLIRWPTQNTPATINCKLKYSYYAWVTDDERFHWLLIK